MLSWPAVVPESPVQSAAPPAFAILQMLASFAASEAALTEQHQVVVEVLTVTWQLSVAVAQDFDWLTVCVAATELATVPVGTPVLEGRKWWEVLGMSGTGGKWVVGMWSAAVEPSQQGCLMTSWAGTPACQADLQISDWHDATVLVRKWSYTVTVLCCLCCTQRTTSHTVELHTLDSILFCMCEQL